MALNLKGLFGTEGISSEKKEGGNTTDNVNAYQFSLGYYADSETKGNVLRNLAELRGVTMDALLPEMNKHSRDSVMELLFSTALKQERTNSYIKKYCAGQSVNASMKTLMIPRINRGFKIGVQIQCPEILGYKSWKISLKGYGITVRGLFAVANGYNKTELSFEKFIAQKDTDISTVLSIKVTLGKQILSFYAVASVDKDSKVTIHNTYLLTGDVPNSAHQLIDAKDIEGMEDLLKSVSKIKFLGTFAANTLLPSYYRTRSTGVATKEVVDNDFDQEVRAGIQATKAGIEAGSINVDALYDKVKHGEDTIIL